MSSWFSSIDMMSIFAAICSLFGYSLSILYLSYLKKRQETRDWNKRLGGTIQDLPDPKIQARKLLKEEKSADPFIDKIRKFDRFAQWIEHTGLHISPFSYVISGLVLAGIIFSFLVFFLQTSFVFSFFIGTFSSFLIFRYLILFLIKKQKRKFMDNFPVALDIIYRGLRAGHSTDQALAMVAAQTEGLLGDIFRMLADKMGLGESLEVVLSDTANKLGIDDFRMFAIVLVLQQETGGSLAEAMNNFSKIIRSRQYLKKKMKVLTGEVRGTALILTAIPFGITFLIYLFNPTYLSVLVDTQRGQKVLLGGLCLLAVGLWTIFHMAYKDMY